MLSSEAVEILFVRSHQHQAPPRQAPMIVPEIQSDEEEIVQPRSEQEEQLTPRMPEYFFLHQSLQSLQHSLLHM